MKSLFRRFLSCWLGVFALPWPWTLAFESNVSPLIDASCLECHDRDTKTALNFEALPFDLENPETFRTWEKVFDQIETDEMPPEKKRRPDPVKQNAALASLGQHLREASLAWQKRNGRAPARRLTRSEYEHTLHDLLGIGGDLASKLPPENASGAFDTVANDQGISPVHIRSYLAAADAALDEAIELGPRPRTEPRVIDYRNHRYVQMWFERGLRNGGDTVWKTDDAFLIFDDRPHTTRTDNMAIPFQVAGRYRIVAEAYSYQAKTPVTFCIYRGNDQAGNSELVGSWQLKPGETREVKLETFFVPGDYFYIVPAELDEMPDGRGIFHYGAKRYPGEGLAIRKLTLEGPLENQWPPERTRNLLGDVDYQIVAGGSYNIELNQAHKAQIADVVSRIGPRLFRSPIEKAQAELWTSLADPVVAEGRDFQDGLRVVLGAMLTSPQFLYHSANPGKLDEYALASRLSFFLWKTFPDDELLHLASEGKLSEPEFLASEVDRMLDDDRSRRFTEDFLGQWLELDEIDATRPDEKLYPEYDDLLRQAMLEETHRYFEGMIWDDKGIRELIDSDYTFLNGRLARHYGIPNVEGLDFRKVQLPANSPRGGILTQASILKVTANGTNTSPVPRGNFVLSNLLGTPPSPPPPGIGAVEPDTRGTTTIREELAAHREVESCHRCHQDIDPPGFALESFDPIGGFRTRYRSTGTGDRPTGKIFGRRIREYRLGQPVDASGKTAEGQSFSGIKEFKTILLEKEDEVAKHFLRQLIAYSTGSEIQFADRDEMDRLVAEAKRNNYGIRSMIHSVVQSRIFLNK